MRITEKVAYMQGLMSGLKIDESTNEGKVLLQMSEILAEMADVLDGMQDEIGELTELVDIIDQDLGDVEEALLEDDDDDCDCDCCDDYDDFDDDEFLYEVVCPTCGDSICLDEDMLDEGSINCPNCNELLEFDFDECDCEGDCDCE
ncbi:MAG: hypothetical protein E7507_00965 [Ruminococcus sp.]|nr:hypothetical protein [Ruminococcus sp.]